MSEPSQPPNLTPEKTQRLQKLFATVLPLVDSVADKLLMVLILGTSSAIWIAVWSHAFKHHALGFTVLITVLVALPVLLLFWFWWSLIELKDLPNIAGRMMADAQSEVKEKIQGLKEGKLPKLGLLSATKGLWSLGSITWELRELLGSYLSIAALLNPLMLILAAISLAAVLLSSLIAAVLGLLTMF